MHKVREICQLMKKIIEYQRNSYGFLNRGMNNVINYFNLEIYIVKCHRIRIYQKMSVLLQNHQTYTPSMLKK